MKDKQDEQTRSIDKLSRLMESMFMAVSTTSDGLALTNKGQDFAIGQGLDFLVPIETSWSPQKLH